MSDLLHVTPDNPMPAGAKAGKLGQRPGRQVRYATFPATGRPLKGTVILLSGRNETIEKYFETVRDLSARGFTVAALDWRGQGGSDRLLRDPDRGFVRSFDQYVSDLELLFEEVVLPDCRAPFYLLGHSTGGLVALLAAPRLLNRVRRMVLTAPLLGLVGYPLRQANIHRAATALTLAGLGRVYFGGGPKRPHRMDFEDNPLTSDPDRFHRNRTLLETFPKLSLGGPTAAWVRAACRAIRTVSEPGFMAQMRIPTLFIAAGRDRVVSTPAIEDYASRLPSGALVTIDRARHEILQEADRFREAALAAFDAFVPGSDTGI
ncbi:MAG TPA: alpha/beta hydrolase [Mesorhizobium sp.]|jgi:lysophospholipase|nr:alpha/beta hydrolase [Mesorhizobium sp.]